MTGDEGVTTYIVGYFVGSLAKESINRKLAGVIGTSPGKIGTAVGQQHVRSILAFIGRVYTVLPRPA